MNRYYSADPGTDALMKQVTQASRNKLAELSETMKLYDEGKEANWRGLLLSNIGKEQMDTVRSLSQQLLDRETAKVDVARQSLSQTLLLNRIV